MTLLPRSTDLHRLSRREWLTLSAAGVVGWSLSGWLQALAAQAAGNPQRHRACILLWMNGGPSQMDTFDLKPGHANGGPFQEITTNVPGIRIREHLPQLARHADKLAIVRSMSTREADHGRGTHLMRTGHAPGGPIQYPAVGALFAKELMPPDLELPAFVSIAPAVSLVPAAYQSGFLGADYAPLILGANGQVSSPRSGYPDNDFARLLRVQDSVSPADVSAARVDARLQLLEESDQAFLRDHAAVPTLSHRAAYNRAVALMRSSAASAFSLDQEPARLRDAYGRNLFGQGCLLARRLAERGVPFVEVTLSGVADANGWDTHRDNFNALRQLCGVLDPAWATLMEDLRDKGLLETTLVVWMGEFGRTPRINLTNGRDHWARSWSTVLGGGGIRGGQVVGRTTADGIDVAQRPVTAEDFLATVGRALGIDITRQNLSNTGQPIPLIERTANPIREVLA
jgi:uncharacterized protein (DUF1501 family)